MSSLMVFFDFRSQTKEYEAEKAKIWAKKGRKESIPLFLMSDMLKHDGWKETLLLNFGDNETVFSDETWPEEPKVITTHAH